MLRCNAVVPVVALPELVPGLPARAPVPETG